MGLSINYHGRIKEEASLQEMIEEIKDIANVYSWEYHVLDENFPEKLASGNDHDGKLYGIVLVPPECELVSICFLSNKKMCCPSLMQAWGDSDIPEQAE